MSKIKHNFNENMSAHYDAFAYQHEAFMAIRDLDYAAVFHEQGLGKTKIAIDLMLYWLQNRDIDAVLVVTKKTLVPNWVKEFGVHTSLRPKVLDNNKGSNFYVFNSSTRILITNFETVSGEKERLKLFLKTRNVAIVMDESTKIKNPESKLTQDFFELIDLFKIRLIMTGTPVANRPYDIWSQIYFLDKGKALGQDFKAFKRSCDLSNDLWENTTRRNEFEYTVSSVFKLITSFTVRETKNSGIISLPSKSYHDIIVKFSPIQLAMYNQVKEEMRLELHKEGEIILDESPEAIKRLLRLVQVTSNPAILDDTNSEISSKEIALDELITSILEKDEQIIVWSIFTSNVDSFCKKYNEKGVCKITGKMSIEDRVNSVENFKSGRSRILFATPQSAKEGLTLTEANHAIFYDRGFNLDDYLQAQDRIHRISQKKECHIYNLMVEDSIDIWINLLLEAKQRAAYLAQGDISLKEYKRKADYSFSQIVNEILKN